MTTQPVAAGQPRPPIVVPREQLADFCRRNHIRWLALFGSALRDDFRPDSDVDVLVEFEPGTTVTLFTLSRLQREPESSSAGRLCVERRPQASHPRFRPGQRAGDLCELKPYIWTTSSMLPTASPDISATSIKRPS